MNPLGALFLLIGVVGLSIMFPPFIFIVLILWGLAALTKD